MINNVSMGAAGGVGATGGANGFPYMSPEGMLAYCQTQLQGLDSEMQNHLGTQERALRDRQAIEKVQTAVESFGNAGPQDPDAVGGMQKCYDAYQNAIASLPQDDPMRQQLAEKCSEMCATYQFTPGKPLSPEQQQQLNNANMVLDASKLPGSTETQAVLDHANDVKNQLEAQQNGTLGVKPNKDTNQWSGETEKLKSLSDDVKSGAEIDMLQLQDLVSQRQTFVQVATSAMAKMDETALTVAKNI